MWYAAVDNVLVPQIPLLTSGKTPTGVVLKQFLIHTTGTEPEGSCLQEPPINIS